MIDDSENGVKKSLSYYDEISDKLSGNPSRGIYDDSLTEDTVKQGSQWVNKGKAGTHGKFKTKKAANAQRKAMFANKKPGATWGK